MQSHATRKHVVARGLTHKLHNKVGGGTDPRDFGRALPGVRERPRDGTMALLELMVEIGASEITF